MATAPLRPSTRPSSAARDENSSALTPARRRLALFALALGGFGIGCSEFVSMGLLPGIAHTLLPGLMAEAPEQGIARAGLAISAYALGVVVGAPTVAVLAVRMSRTRLIALLAVALLVGTVLSAIMPTFDLTILARFVAGLPHGAYFGVASLIAASLMGPGSQGKGVALALSGLTIANLLGVPLLTAFGQNLGWRISYLLIAAVFAVTVVMLLTVVPHQGRPAERSVVEELSAFRSKQVWAVIGIGAVGFAGAFAVFSYIAEISQQVAGTSAAFVPIVLACAGLGMTLGNMVGGWATDRSQNGTMFIGFPLYIAALVALFLFSGSPVGLMATLFLVNLANAMLGPAVQTWLIKAAGPSQVLGASLNHASFNVANSLGAALGGAVIAAGYGFRAPAVVAIVLASTGFAMVLAALGTKRALARRSARVRPVPPVDVTAPAGTADASAAQDLPTSAEDATTPSEEHRVAVAAGESGRDAADTTMR
ncbi:MFS transporter [Brachybacterium sp. AOP25-B2-12]|uniref:MFS transporter n=1 Tax=Brachybacterium sp. AOP25-B2-12 TaxID=3457710 RepID=UPI004034081C